MRYTKYLVSLEGQREAVRAYSCPDSDNRKKKEESVKKVQFKIVLKGAENKTLRDLKATQTNLTPHHIQFNSNFRVLKPVSRKSQ